MRTWETAEISRSIVEAQLTTTNGLRLGARSRVRYQDPPADTCFPLEYAYHLLGDVRGKRVVDFGCGSGANTIHLALRGASVLALDISESLIRIGRQRLEANGIERSSRYAEGSVEARSGPRRR